MKIGFFIKKGGRESFYGEVRGNSVIKLTEDFRVSEGDEIDLRDLEIQATANPTKIVAIGLNYRRHAVEMNQEIPDSPVLFLKPQSSILPSRGRIIYLEASSSIQGMLLLLSGMKKGGEMIITWMILLILLHKAYRPRLFYFPPLIHYI